MDELNSNNNNILVCYLITKFDNQKTLENFITHYKKFSSGLKHDLLICFKLLNNEIIKKYQLLLKDINYINFDDNSYLNDFDFGSYKRVAEHFPTKTIFFLNSHSYPITNNWLKKLTTHFKDKTIIGTSASHESFFTTLKLKKFYKIFSFFKKYNKYKKFFEPFPNPHIRTSSFLIKGSDFLFFVRNKNFFDKEDTWIAESGFEGLTNFFIKKKFNIFVVNSEGRKFSKNNWKFSETYCYLNQSKSLISDKHSRKYLKLSFKERLITSIKVWGY